MDECTQVQRLPTQDGPPVYLEVKKHRGALCQEFIVSSANFSVKKWLLWTVAFNIIGFMLQLHTKDPRIMSGLLGVVVILLLLKINFKVHKESLLVMASLGVQLTTTFRSGRTHSCFYDMHHVKDVVINEGITMHRVIYYLTLLLQEDQRSQKVTKLIPLFTHSWPGLSCLKKIYQGSQEVLKTSTNKTTSKSKHGCVTTKATR